MISVQEAVPVPDMAEASPVVASWPAPLWAEKSTREESAVIHSRQLCLLRDLDGKKLTVMLFQHDEMLLSPEDEPEQFDDDAIRLDDDVPPGEWGTYLAVSTVTRTPVYAIIGHAVRVSPEQAEEVAQALLSIAGVVSQ